MNEAYVSLETAKLLREKGFDENCLYVYTKDEARHFIPNFHQSSTSFLWKCPTQQMACRWLREIKNIDIEPFVYSHHHDGSKDYGCNIQQNGHLLMTESFVHIRYEDAVEAALEYALKNLI